MNYKLCYRTHSRVTNLFNVICVLHLFLTKSQEKQISTVPPAKKGSEGTQGIGARPLKSVRWGLAGLTGLGQQDWASLSGSSLPSLLCELMMFVHIDGGKDGHVICSSLQRSSEVSTNGVTLLHQLG